MITPNPCPHNIVHNGICAKCGKAIPKKPDKPNLQQAFKRNNPVLGI